MTIPSEFALLHYGKEIVMLANSLQDPVTNLPISHTAFARLLSVVDVNIVSLIPYMYQLTIPNYIMF